MHYKLLAKASACRIYDLSGNVLIKREPHENLNTSLFVVAFLTFIIASNGIVFLFNAELFKAGIIMTVISVVFGFLLILLIKKKKAIRKLSPEDLDSICILDFETHILLDGKKIELASLKEVRIARKFQITSSSKKLVLEYPKGSILIANGNPFAGGITILERVLSEKLSSVN